MNFFSADKASKRIALIAPALASSLFLGGCMSSPTYGTDKTANEQLLTDVSNIVALSPKRRDAITYSPRPDLVKPTPGADKSLPPPQEQVAAAGNPDWPESPEQRRARIRKEADENSGNANFEPEVVPDGQNKYDQWGGVAMSGKSPREFEAGGRPTLGQTRKSREEFNTKLAETRQGDAAKRKYLSEPPIKYREASAAAPQGDVGEDEYKKERRAKAAARKKTGNSWRDYVPGL